jgi:formamidopyrimidine-DNA glycosylase
MPELPEVERGRGLAESVAAGRVIERVRCARDPIVFDGVSPARMRAALLGRRVRAVRRRGKHLWFELDRRPWPCFHFGMTGAFRVPDAAPRPLASNPSGRSEHGWPPRFSKIRLWLDDGRQLVMTNARRLGRIRLRHDPAGEPPISALGFDPLLDLPPARDLVAAVTRRNTSLKALLMDQAFAAGVGNWIADEVLYQAALDPRRKASTLTAPEVRRLHSRLRAIITTAVRVDADASRFPRTWLFHRRWGRDPNAVTARGEAIRHITVAGRTTAWVPSAQR